MIFTWVVAECLSTVATATCVVCLTVRFTFFFCEYKLLNYFLFVAVSDDGLTILLVRKKDIKETILEQASTSKGVLGCKIKDGRVILDKNTHIEAQIAMHVCGATKLLFCFVNTNDHNDYLLEEVDFESTFFVTNVEEKLTSFLENVLLPKVHEKDVPIKR